MRRLTCVRCRACTLQGDRCVQPSFIPVGSFSTATATSRKVVCLLGFTDFIWHFLRLNWKLFIFNNHYQLKRASIFTFILKIFTFTLPSLLPPSTPKCMPAHSSICLCYQCYQSTTLAVSSAHRMPNEVLTDEHTHASVRAGLYLTHERPHSFPMWSWSGHDLGSVPRRRKIPTSETASSDTMYHTTLRRATAPPPGPFDEVRQVVKQAECVVGISGDLCQRPHNQE